MDDVSVQIVGSQSQRLVRVLGTDTVAITPPVPVHSPGQDTAFLVDVDKLTNEQKRRLVEFLANEYNLSASKIEELLPRHGLGIPARDCVMRHISQYQIDLLRESYNGERDADHESFSVSTAIVTLMLGCEWIGKNLLTEEERVSYLRTRLETEQERFEHVSRITSLADSLFLLQNCEGFDLKLEELRSLSPRKPEVKLEDIAIELDIARNLVKSGHEVKFRSRSGIKRQDFDIEIYFRRETTLFAEIKCKREETAANVNNLRRTLYEAEKQLPTDKPGVIFVRIPTERIKYGNLAAEVNRAIRNFFRNISYVNLVAFIWEEWIKFQDNRRANVMKFKLNLHPSPQHRVRNLDDLILTIQIPPRAKGGFMELSFGVFSDE